MSAQQLSALDSRVAHRFESFRTKHEAIKPSALSLRTANQRFKQWLVAGVWEDTTGKAHVDADRLCMMLELPYTTDNIADVTRFAARLLKAETGREL